MACALAAAGLLTPRPGPAADQANDGKSPNALINKDLLRAARRNAVVLTAKNPDAWAPDIQDMQARVDRYLTDRKHPFFDRAVVLDPARFDAAAALGIPPRQTAGRVIAEHSRLPVRAQDAGTLAGSFAGKGVSPLGNTGEAVMPAVVILPQDRVCLMLPLPENAMFTPMALSIPWLDARTLRDFGNAHDLNHCKDRFYDLLEIRQKLASRSALLRREGETLMLKKETYGDAAATGDMIRGQGYGPELIESIAIWRARLAGEDPAHYSSPALRALKAAIVEMGVDRFRRMSEAEAENLYFTVVEDHTVPPEAFDVFRSYVTGDATAKKDLRNEARTVPEVRQGLAMLEDVIRSRDIPPRAAPADPASHAVLQKVQDWDAAAALEDRAFADAGKVTPAAVFGAYAVLQNDLRRQMKAAPGDPLPAEQAAKLRTVFITGLQKMDFAGETAKRRAAKPPRAAPGG